MPKRWDENKIKLLREIVPLCKNYTEVVVELGLRAAGGNYRTVKKYILDLNLDTNHFDPLHRCRKAGKTQRIPLEKILVRNSSYKSWRLKKRLLEEGMIEDICEECGQEPFWKGKRLNLPLDHRNGVHSDNRRENLRILCPNCHSQTKTFAGKNNRKGE